MAFQSGQKIDGTSLTLAAGNVLDETALSSNYATYRVNVTMNNTVSKMIGLGTHNFTYTPSFTGNIIVLLTLEYYTVLGAANTTELYYGTGSAPVNGATVTGTSVGIPVHGTCQISASGGCNFVYTYMGKITGLTLSTAYWFDLSILTNSHNTNPMLATIQIIEY